MRGQSHRNYCGPACVANVLRAFGYDREATEDRVARKMKIRPGAHVDGHPAEGTSERQISAALSAYRLPHEQVDAHDPTIALSALRGALVSGARAILCVDSHEHWVAALGVAGDHTVVADPADPEIVLSLSPAELADRWRMAGDPPSYFAILVYPRSRRKRQ